MIGLAQGWFTDGELWSKGYTEHGGSEIPQSTRLSSHETGGTNSNLKISFCRYRNHSLSALLKILAITGKYSVTAINTVSDPRRRKDVGQSCDAHGDETTRNWEGVYSHPIPMPSFPPTGSTTGLFDTSSPPSSDIMASEQERRRVMLLLWKTWF